MSGSRLGRLRVSVAIASVFAAISAFVTVASAEVFAPGVW